MNSLLRVSSEISNGAVILNVDCDMYSNNSQSIRDALCFFMDEKKSQDIGFVQFPQNFENTTKNDIYGSTLQVISQVEFHGLDGLGGPLYVGTGCFHQREILCGRKYSKDYKIDWKTSKMDGTIFELEERAKSLASCVYELNSQWGKELHPDWSTTAIKSAIMTTASNNNATSPLDNEGMPIRDSDKISDANPFAYGHTGRATLNRMRQWILGSDDIDMMAAIDDDVDIINYSQGYSSSSGYFDDAAGIATFHAMKNGILTIAGAGNSGPNPGIVGNNYPWVLSVGASTTDRVFFCPCLTRQTSKAQDAIGLILDYAGFWIHSCSSCYAQLVGGLTYIHLQ
uniref:Peptidase S8/S53 domain-containing protein n=1 Tax=Chenopodium quinoa TaxID=63459 RepID=A0A803NDG6_CHEQI